MSERKSVRLRKLLRITGQALLWVVALALTVGANTAISNGRSWIDLVGSSTLFGWLPQFRIPLIAIVFFALGWMVRNWLTGLRNTDGGVQTFDIYGLYDRMDTLADQIKTSLQNEGSGWLSGRNQHELATDCYSFNTTLQKAGFTIPDVAKLKLRDRLAVFAYYYVNVGPYLRDGHVAEAKAIASDLSPKAVAQIEQNP